MLGTPEVMQCYDVTGEADFIVVITVKDMQEYETLSRKLFMENPCVRRYKTSLVVRRVKSGTMLPIISEQH
jgi:Lrp/AsnC family leucine-responsive transcriptional regulator